MRLSIYQLKPQYEDLYKLSFDEFKVQAGDTPKSPQYKKVFTGVVKDDTDLEDLFDILSNDLPNTYKGKEFGVSDIIGIEEDGDNLKANTYYYCDNKGWGRVGQFNIKVEEPLEV